MRARTARETRVSALGLGKVRALQLGVFRFRARVCPLSEGLRPAICGGCRPTVGDMRRVPAPHLPETRCSLNLRC